MPKHRCAAGVAPQNLLFPAWLPGTVEDFTPETIARQLAVAWCSGVAGVAGIGWLPGTVFGGGALLEADAFEYRRGDVDSLQCRPSHSFRCDSDGQAHRRRRSTSGISAVGRRLPVSADFQDADSASCKARRSSLVRSSPSSSATRSTTVPSGKVVGSSRTRRPFSTRARRGLIGPLYGIPSFPSSLPTRRKADWTASYTQDLLVKNGETKTKLVKVGTKFKAGGGESFGYEHLLLDCR